MSGENNNPYADIIDLPHHVSPTRKRMSRRDRAAQFAPFAALTGYGDAIEETARQTKSWQDLYEDDRASMEDKLQLLAEEILRRQESGESRPEAEAIYFVRDPFKDGGSFQTTAGRVKRVDALNRLLVFEEGAEVPLADLVGLELSENSIE